MSELHTLLKLIALNGKDVGEVIVEFLSYYSDSPPEGNINHVQAKMLGWIELLNMQTKRVLELYEGLPAIPEFQKMVDRSFDYLILSQRQHILDWIRDIQEKTGSTEFSVVSKSSLEELKKMINQ